MFFAKLSNGTMPLLGYGTYKITDEVDATECVMNALETGYRHIDTATLYRNEKQIGEALCRCGLKRKELFLADKLWTDVRTAEDVNRAVHTMLDNLKTNYLDLLMIHWPTPHNVAVWKQMEKLAEEGIVKNIGLSNFLPHHIEDILRECQTAPVLNQVELHPVFQQKELRNYCAEHKILVEAWSPLMRGAALQNEVLADIAATHGKTVAQVIIRYDLQLGLSVVPKTTNKARMKENFDVFDFELSPEEMRRIEDLDRNERQYRHPDRHGY